MDREIVSRSDASNNPIVAALGELGFAQMHLEAIQRTIPHLTVGERFTLQQQLMDLQDYLSRGVEYLDEPTRAQ